MSKLYQIDYDLRQPGRNYESLIPAIKALGTSWCHPLKSTWVVETDSSAWQEKIDTTHLGDTPTSTTISTMLSWASPVFTKAAIYWCQPRNTREQKVYRLTAWARRLAVQNQTASADQDWHIELTSTKTIPVKNNCIVIEIPPDNLNPAYFQARQDFLAVITDAGSIINGSGDVVPPVRLKVTGLAFFDGEHRGAGTNPPYAHGRCNQKTSALWEIHPVYSVNTP